MPDFVETPDIIIQPGDFKVPYSFSFSVASSATANDGSIPFGTNISTVAVTGTMLDGTSDDELVFSSSVSSNVVTVKLSYPSTNGLGDYKLEFLNTLDNADSTIIESDFNRVIVKDL